MSARGFVLAAMLALGGCAAPPAGPGAGDRVVLLPHADGTVGTLTVREGGAEVTLDSAYAAAVRGPDGGLTVANLDRARVEAEFGEVLSALPPAPAAYTLLFVLGRDELTDESKAALEPILEAIARRPAPEITVTGHADQTGPERVNETLALRRAERVRDLLVQRGISLERITVSGRGSRDPAVNAPQGVAEARNRRVEVSVR
jgi:outer membrane protein OmpA-like peptidoglycan-associated protein